MADLKTGGAFGSSKIVTAPRQQTTKTKITESRTKSKISTTSITPRSSTDEGRVSHLTHRMPLPLPGTPGAPFFTGKNATEFLETLTGILREAGINDDETKADCLVSYSHSAIAWRIKMWKEYGSGEWEYLKTVILREFAHSDDVQIRKTEKFLCQLVAMHRTDEDDLAAYCHAFRNASKKLVEDGEITKSQEVDWFIRGLPDEMRLAVIEFELSKDDTRPTIEEMIKYVLKWDAVRREISRRHEPIDASHFMSTPSVDSILQESNTTNTPKVKNGLIVAPSVPAAIAPVTDEDKLPEEFTTHFNKAMEKLVEAVLDRQTRSTNTYVQRPGYLEPARTRNGVPMAGNPTDKQDQEGWYQYFRRTNRCYFCEEVGHIGRRCPVAARLIKEGKICRDKQGMYCPGPPELRNPPFNTYGVQGGLLRQANEWITQAEKVSELPEEIMLWSLCLYWDDES